MSLGEFLSLKFLGTNLISVQTIPFEKSKDKITRQHGMTRIRWNQSLPVERERLSYDSLFIHNISVYLCVQSRPNRATSLILRNRDILPPFRHLTFCLRSQLLVSLLTSQFHCLSVLPQAATRSNNVRS